MLSNSEWKIIKLLLPPRSRADDRIILNGILYFLVVGIYKRMRFAVERFFGWIKNFRRIVIRYERFASTYKALVTIACIIIHLRLKEFY